MSLAKTHRWVYVTDMRIMNPSKVPAHVPTYTFSDIEKGLRSRLEHDHTDYLYHTETKKMKIRDIINVGEEYLCLLVSAGDKNAPDVAYEDFKNGNIRSVEKEEDEGAVVTSHILIRKQKVGVGHLMLVERVAGISPSQVQLYLRSLFSKIEAGEAKSYLHNGEETEYRPLFDVLGYQAQTLRDAIAKNTLQDIEFVSRENQDSKLDEYDYIQEKVHQVKYIVKRGIETNTIEPFIKGMMNKFKKGNFDEMFVRIKTDNNQIKNTEIRTEREDILSQYFICNEKVDGFEEPLESACIKVREDMVDKLCDVASKYSN